MVQLSDREGTCYMKVLVIAAGAFAPWNIIGAIRWTKICKYMSQDGEILTVIGQEKGLQKKDELLIQDASMCHRVYYMSESIMEKCIRFVFESLGKAKKQSKETSIRKYNTLMTSQKYFRLLNYFNFTSKAKRCIRKIEDDFDIVISTNPICAHWAAMYAAQKLNIPWIADFRDPIAPTVPKDRYGKWLMGWQEKICKKADSVIAVSKGLKDVLCNGESQLIEKTHVIYNGYDPVDKPQTKMSVGKGLNFVYTGILYNGKRDLSVVFRAIHELILENKLINEQIEFHYAGEDYNILKSQASQYDMDNMLVDHGFVSRKEALGLQAASDVLVIATYNDLGNPGVMPGKLYEYMMIQKPILAIVIGAVQGSELKKVISESDVGFCYETSFDDINSLKQFILHISNIKQKNDMMRLSYNTGKFEYPSIAKQVCEVIKDTIKECRKK